MAGELWRGTVQTGVETVYGTGVAATRILYLREPVFTREREPRIHRFMTQTRDTVRNVTLGPTKIGGKVTLPLSAEIIEFLLIGMKGAVTPTGAGATKTWTFTPGTSLNSATFEWHDGTRPWKVAGVYADSLNIKGAVSGENILSAELFGKDISQQALTGALTSRVPAVFGGWEAKVYIDNFSGTPGTTVQAGLLLNWDMMFKNGLGRKYFADNTLNTGAIVMGELDITAKLVVEASAAQALTEYNNWDAVTKRLVRLEFGNNTLIGAGPDKEKITIDLPGAWAAVDLGQSDEGTRAYELSLQAIYDPTNTFACQVIVTTARTAAW